MTAGFQQQVYQQPAVAVAGDFASANPYWSYDAGPGGLVAGPGGLVIGRFAWTFPPVDPNGTNTIAVNHGAGPVAGFVHREMQGLITGFLADAGMTIPAGIQCTLHTGGDYWVVNDGTTEANVGMKAYANFADGKVSFAATGSPLAGAVATGSIAASTGSFTGSIAGDILTITAVGSGVVVPGGILSGSGVTSGTQVISQLTGTTGGVGTYLINFTEQTVASTTISETYGTFTAASGLTGTFGIGDVLSGSGVTTGTTITALGTGTGGLGTYIVSPTQTAGSTSISAATNVETKWIAMSSGLAGEMVKISAQPLG